MNQTGLRVMHVVNRVQERGDGIANVCVDLACQQAQDGAAVGLSCESGGFVELTQSHGVVHYPVTMGTRNPLALGKAFLSLRRTLREFQPDIIHAHTLTATVMARGAAIGSRVKVIATVHNEYQPGVMLMRFAHCVVGVSAAVSNAMIARRIAARRVRTVYNGTVGSARRTSGSTMPPSLGAPQLAAMPIVAIGAVSRRKGADLLLEAYLRIADRHPECELYYVGNLDWPDIVERAQATDHADRVHFEGFHPQPQSYLRGSTIFVLPSRRDPFPLVLLEALEAGVPIVAAAVDGVPEALAHGVAGVLVKPESAAELAEALEDLIEDPARRAELATAARAQSELFSVVKMARDYDEIYQTLSADRPRSTGA